jgi:hypothetical protein
MVGLMDCTLAFISGALANEREVDERECVMDEGSASSSGAAGRHYKRG